MNKFVLAGVVLVGISSAAHADPTAPTMIPVPTEQLGRIANYLLMDGGIMAARLRQDLIDAYTQEQKKEVESAKLVSPPPAPSTTTDSKPAAEKPVSK